MRPSQDQAVSATQQSFIITGANTPFTSSTIPIIIVEKNAYSKIAVNRVSIIRASGLTELVIDKNKYQDNPK